MEIEDQGPLGQDHHFADTNITDCECLSSQLSMDQTMEAYPDLEETQTLRHCAEHFSNAKKTK